MQHLVQQGAVIGDEVAAAGWQVEGDGSAASVVSWIVRALPDAFAEGQCLADDEWDRPERVIEVGAIKFAPGVGDVATEDPPGLRAAWRRTMSGCPKKTAVDRVVLYNRCSLRQQAST
jgi:hypothetical protein